jgi:hypothetical protein
MNWKKRLGAVSTATLLGITGQAFAQPANDACGNAQALVVASNSSVTVSGTTVAATNDSNSGNCGSSNATPDVWYTVVAPANGVLTASTCGSTGTFDSVLSFRTGSGACPGTNINCVDDSCGNFSSVSISAVAGTTYRIRVSGWNGSTGAFSLTVTHQPPAPPPSPTIGPDVITAVITDVPNWGLNTAGTIRAFSVGTTSCNPGDYPVLWVDNTSFLPDFDATQHPVIGQNMFRYTNYGTYSRFEHIGQSWLKHGFVSTNSPGCGGCAVNGDNIWRFSTGGMFDMNGDVLGINCSDTYSGSLNGSQGGLGAKNIVNATLGTSPFVKGNNSGDTNTRGRLQVAVADLATPAGATGSSRFFVEGHYVTADDAQFVRPGQTVAINGLNNASYREISASFGGSSVPFVGNTVVGSEGIRAWKAADPAVTLVNADHDDTVNPGTGYRDPATWGPQYPVGTTFVRSRFIVGVRVGSLGGGLYRYEYAIQNLNSDRAAQAFSIPFPDSASMPTDITFRAPAYHSGEPYSNAAWTANKGSGKLTFSGETFAQNANANALRWGTVYSFGFTTDVPPTSGSADLTFFKPGTGTGLTVGGLTVPTVPAACNRADITDIGDTGAGPDGQLTVDDVIGFINSFSDGIDCPGTAPCNRADITDIGDTGAGADGELTVDDIIAYFNSFSDGCL